MAQVDVQSTIDESLEETRRIKAELAAQFDFDVDRILGDARKRQVNVERKVIAAPRASKS